MSDAVRATILVNGQPVATQGVVPGKPNDYFRKVAGQHVADGTITVTFNDMDHQYGWAEALLHLGMAPATIPAEAVRGISLHTSPQGTHVRVDFETDRWGADTTTHKTTADAMAYLAKLIPAEEA